jgi:CheY-like chemotaxis protein
VKVLVVDDEPLVRLSLKRVLSKRGHHVAEAEDGKQALKSWPQFNPDLVFLDVLMPGLSGPDLLKQLHVSGLAASAKVVLMSAFTGEYDLEKAKSLGADLFVPKPFEDVFAVAALGEGLVSGQ